ncbi:MAG: hypothetical protein LBS81_00340 [Endomicrobium sp.]|nr:hypothetical protein [Endomicrobium sp.]
MTKNIAMLVIVCFMLNAVNLPAFTSNEEGAINTEINTNRPDYGIISG